MKAGHITSDERDALSEIYDYNPLLFDYVIKRTIKPPKTKQAFSPAIFVKPRFL